MATSASRKVIFVALAGNSLIAVTKFAAAGIEAIATENPGIDRLNEIRTMHFGPEDVLVTLSLNFTDRISAGHVERIISAMEQRIKQTFPEVSQVYIEAQS